MSWLTNIFKGSSGHKRHYHGNDRYWEQTRIPLDDLADTEKEEFECAIALSLSEMDQKGKKVIDFEEYDSDEDNQSTRDPSKDGQSSRSPSELGQSSNAPSEDGQSPRTPSDDWRSSNAQSEVDDDDEVKVEVEGLDQSKTQLEDDAQLAIAIQESESQLEEDELLAKAIQESLILAPPLPPSPSPSPSPAKHDTGNVFTTSLLPLFSSGSRTCAGCNIEIGRGRFLSCMGGVWHPECFQCHSCNLPITDYEFSMSDNRPYHKSCYKEQHHPKCDVCSNFIPTNPVGLIEYRAHPFWLQKYCPSHERDGTPRCCSCERMEPRDTRYLSLDDGRKLCLECLDSSIMDTHECQPLYLEILEFYEGLNMKVEQQIPMLLVERQALNEAMEGEKNGHHHLPETRGLCLSEEQCITTIIQRPKIGAGYRIVDMITEPYRLVRQCEVTAILILYGLPRLLTGSILAHELMHAWLRLNGYPNLRPEVEEGICQVLAHMWLDSEMYSGSGSEATSSSSSSSSSSSLSSSSTTSSKKGKRSDFEKKLGEYFKHQIESDTSSAYGDGFRLGNQAVLKFGLRRTLNHIQLTGSFP